MTPGAARRRAPAALDVPTPSRSSQVDEEIAPVAGGERQPSLALPADPERATKFKFGVGLAASTIVGF